MASATQPHSDHSKPPLWRDAPLPVGDGRADLGRCATEEATKGEGWEGSWAGAAYTNPPRDRVCPSVLCHNR